MQIKTNSYFAFSTWKPRVLLSYVMPQLDALTYFSQYIWLIVTFGTTYAFVIHFIIPSLASTLKLRAKLNSSNTLKPKGSSTDTIVDLMEYKIAQSNWSNAIPVHSQSLVKTGHWLQSIAALQEVECLLAKKKLCLTLLKRFRLDN